MPRRPLPPGLPSSEPIEIANRLNSAAIHLLRRISRDDGADGVTGARLSALSVLVFGGPLTIGQLARREGVAAPTITRIVDALVRDGLAERQAVEGDRRQSRIVATTTGRTLLERGRARRIRSLAAELESLSQLDLRDLDRALDLLERLERPAATTPTGKESRR